MEQQELLQDVYKRQVYEMVVVNPTEQPIQNVVVKDSLDGAFQVQEDSNISLNEDGTVTVKELVAGAQVTLKYTYEIPADAKAGSLETVSYTHLQPDRLCSM